MSATDKELVKAAGSIPAPQYYNPLNDRYEPITGRNGANAFIEKGRVVKDVVESLSDVTKTYSTEMFGVGIVNDGIADLTFSINKFTITVKPGESFDDLFEAFTEITINATSKFRAVIRE
ncbi:MAG: hypothetical protein ABS938_08920 [Psychrobacillus psychrodurans]